MSQRCGCEASLSDAGSTSTILLMMNQAAVLEAPEHQPEARRSEAATAVQEWVANSDGSVIMGQQLENNGQTVGDVTASDPVISVRNCDVYYDDTQALKDINLDIGRGEVIALIGPSGCGKSTFLRCLNRMNDTIDSARVSGVFNLYGEDIYARDTDVVLLRARIGMVFQKPNPFPKSIYENVAYGPRIHGLAASRAEMDDIVYGSLERAGLLDEVKNRIDDRGTSLSGGQQQRLCIARTIAVNPEVILMDEPCSSLDPIATAKIEDLIDELSENYAIAIITHSMHQAARISKRTAYFHLGQLIEVDATNKIFTNPGHRLTEDYVTGRFG